MGTFNEHINPQGYNLGGNPVNENPFFEFEGGGGGGLSPENVNINGSGEYADGITEPDLTVDKVATEDSATFNLKVRVPRPEVPKSPISEYETENTNEKLGAFIMGLYTTLIDKYNMEYKNSFHIAFRVEAEFVNDHTAGWPLSDAISRMATLGVTGRDRASGIRVSNNQLTYYSDSNRVNSSADISSHRSGFPNSGRITMDIKFDKIAGNTNIDVHNTMYITPDPYNRPNSDVTANLVEEGKIWLSLYYDNERWYGGDGEATEYMDFMEISAVSDGEISYDQKTLIGNKGYKYSLGVLDNDTTGFTAAYALLNTTGYIDSAPGTVMTITPIEGTIEENLGD